MKLKVFTLRMDPATGAFDDRELVEFQAEREILDASEHLVVRDGVPSLALVVRWREAARDGRGEWPRRDWRGELDPAGQRAYDALRDWRGRVSRRDGLPPYLVLTNRELAEVAARRPASLADLREVQGVGEAKAGRWGEEVLAVLAAIGEGGREPAPDAVAPAGQPPAGGGRDAPF
ncbi:MAG: HRDC domain-containing protein [Deltaproteobacteria bacterium]|nr:HRDC domain-containing protein [Deltaproteobacteria bacterium]